MIHHVIHFEWDHEKSKHNNQKHGVPFEEAATVFFDPLSATFDDPDHSVGELRFITIGFSSRRRLLVVSYAEKHETRPIIGESKKSLFPARHEIIRIISARRATAQERKRHEDQNPKEQRK